MMLMVLFGLWCLGSSLLSLNGWVVHKSCKHDGVVLLSVASPLGRGANGVGAVA